MDKIRIGVLCPSEIAFRRFMPALQKAAGFEYVGIACAADEEWFGERSEQLSAAERKKAEGFFEGYGGRIFGSYNELLTCKDIDAVYIPLPPALHFKWAKKALLNGKHVLLEKPFTAALRDSEELISLAKKKSLAVHENYMFVFHTQLDYIKKQLAQGEIGDTRLIRIDFGFPFRGAEDFRYNKALGGGALLDCGGYTLKLAGIFLGDTARVVTSHLNGKSGFEVDIYGSATLVNDDGLTAQVSFGMDNSYKCSIEIWGSKGTIFTNRILTAPDGYEPTVTIKTADGERTQTLPPDDTFRKSIEYFGECIASERIRAAHFDEILRQAAAVEAVKGGSCR